MLTRLKSLIAILRAPRIASGAELDRTGSLPISTDWDVAEAAMLAQTEMQQRGIDYRFLGVTGEEDA